MTVSCVRRGPENAEQEGQVMRRLLNLLELPHRQGETVPRRHPDRRRHSPVRGRHCPPSSVPSRHRQLFRVEIRARCLCRSGTRRKRDSIPATGTARSPGSSLLAYRRPLTGNRARGGLTCFAAPPVALRCKPMTARGASAKNTPCGTEITRTSLGQQSDRWV